MYVCIYDMYIEQAQCKIIMWHIGIHNNEFIIMNIIHYPSILPEMSGAYPRGGSGGLSTPLTKWKKNFFLIIYMGMLPDRVKQERWISKLTCALIQVSAQLEKKNWYSL